MVTGELPSVTLIKSLLSPATIVATFIVSIYVFGEVFAGHYVALAILVFLIATQLFDDVDVFRSWRGLRPTPAGKKVLLHWLTIVGIVLFLGFATKLSAHFSRKVMVTWFLVTPFALVVVHIAFRYLVEKMMGGNARAASMVVVGANALGFKLAQKVENDPYLGIEFVGFFDDRHPTRLESGGGPLLGRIADMPAWIREHSVSMIYITLQMIARPRIMKMLDELGDTTASIYFVPDIFVFDLIQARFDELEGIPVVAICDSPFLGFNSILKRLTDIFFASLVLLLIWPLMLVIALSVKATSRGPAIFKQRRYGLDGAEIMVYKFRSMTVAEDGDSVFRQAKRHDSRVTPLGAFLRRTSLDELPQFLNVIQGTMSIVGPRPHPVALNEQYRKVIKRYMIRHKVKPGITGWAQINGYRGETETVEKMQSRVAYDLDYMRNWSVAMDFWIMFRTVTIVFKDRNAY
ncbi:MAG TPA: undecaprenyl-phosphate glucose phosphotransferase [Burkholderiales bacterium]|nr:undecaprenyl-phosphate glucose phosphotransferase [Burkholderiales bacterium]